MGGAAAEEAEEEGTTWLVCWLLNFVVCTYLPTVR